MSEKPLDSLPLGKSTATLENIAEYPRQQALLKTGALQNAIFNSAHFSSIATDAQGVIQLFNVGAERMLGYTASDVVNKITPADISDPQEVIARAEALSLEFGTQITPGFEALAFKASRGIEDIYELTYFRKDGSRFPAGVSVTSLRDAQEAIIGYLLIGTDNTARKQAEQVLLKARSELERLRAEEALRVSEEHYRTLFESIDEGFCIIEKVEGKPGEPLDFRYIEANAAFAVQSGISGALGKTIRQVVPGETEEGCQMYDKVFRTGEPIRFERGLVTQGRVLEFHAFRIEGDIPRRVGVNFKDITQRKLAEDALRESETFTRSIIESSPDCIKVLDLEGNLLSMQSGQQLLGIEDIRPFLNTSWLAFWEGEHRQAAQAAIALATAGKANRFVGFFRTLRGEPKWWDVSISPILDADGKPAQLLAVSRDVTQARHTEMNLNFLASVSQDLVRWTNVDEMMQTVGAKIATFFQLSQCALAEINDTAEQVVINYDWHREDVPSLVGIYRLADFVGEEFIRLARTGEVIVVRNAATDARTDPEKFATLKIASFACVPIIQDRQWRFALCLYHSVAYDWREDEIELMRELTARIWTRLEHNRAEAALRENEWRLRYATASAGLTYVEVDLVNDRAQTPENFVSVMGYAPSEPNADVSVGVRILLEHVVAHDRPQVEAALQQFIGTHAAGKIDYRVLGDDQVERWIESRWSVERGPDGKPLKSFATNLDITERKWAAEALRESEARFRAAVDIVSSLIWTNNAHGLMEGEQPGWGNFTGQTQAEYQAYGWSHAVHPEDAQPTLDAWTQAVAEKRLFEFAHRIRRRDGEWRLCSIRAVPVLGGDGVIREWVGVHTDITERQRNEEVIRESMRELRATEVALSNEKAALADHVLRLQDANEQLVIAAIAANTLAQEIEEAKIQMAHLAQHDVLTDLPNRFLLYDRIAQAIALARRQGKQIAVMFLDIDRFKHINDSLGHAIGDQLLQLVATRLKAVVRSSDTVCRQGGDEFVILLAEVEHAEDALLSAQKIFAALTVPYRIDQVELHVGVSIGISIYPEDGQDADTLIQNADTAMYHVKEGGRNNYQLFEQNMTLLAVQRHSIESGLRSALERQEFLLHYQPKITLETGAISGVEALIRWQHPNLKLILPEQFICIAEDCGLIVPIGVWVLRAACQQAQSWQDAGLPPVPVAVNISAVQFRHKEFLESVATILKDTGLAPRYLELELTESVLMHDAESTASVLKALKAMGVRLAIDDFGTGYSSLSYLKSFPIDTLKIDQSFMRDIRHASSDSDDAAIVAAVVGMGKSLHQRVIAEGVETREQLAFLQAQGCGEGQGFYFSRPLTAEELVPLLQTGLSPTLFS